MSLLYRLPRRKFAINVKAKVYLFLIKYPVMKAYAMEVFFHRFLTPDERAGGIQWLRRCVGHRASLHAF